MEVVPWICLSGSSHNHGEGQRSSTDPSSPAGNSSFWKVVSPAQTLALDSCVVLRGSKVLAKSRWDGSNYEQVFRDLDELWSFLNDVPVGVVVIDRSVPQRLVTPDQTLLIKTLEETASKWELINAFTVTRDGRKHPNGILVYALQGHQLKPAREITIDLKEMLGREIRAVPGR